MSAKKPLTIAGLYRSAKQWTQRVIARYASGRSCEAKSPKAVCWCLYGALEVTYPDPVDRLAAENRLLRAIDQRYPGEYLEIAAFNDDPAISFKEVREVVKLANI